MSELKAIETEYNGYRFRSRLEARWAVFFDTIGIEYEYELEGFEADGVRYLPDFYLPEFRCLFEIKRGGVFEYGVPKTSWMESDDYKKIIAMTETIKLHNNGQSFDYVVLASGSPFDCLTGKEDCGLLFNGIIGVARYLNEKGEMEPVVIPVTEKDSMPLWGHVPVVFEEMIASGTGERVIFLGKASYKDFERSGGKCEIVPIGQKCTSLAAIMQGIVPRYRGEPLFNPDNVEYIALDAQADKESPLYSACIKARQARFEHGETPKVR